MGNKRVLTGLAFFMPKVPVQKIDTTDKNADMSMKPLPVGKLKLCLNLINIYEE